MKSSLPDIEAWGGAECTVNRVGDAFRDQLAATRAPDAGHLASSLAGLGLDAVRFPVLWESVAPRLDGAPDWRCSDAGLAVLREAGVRPIVGLVHHGSGPRHTSLIDDNFAPGLAAYAAQVVARYPWALEWTPANEPLTTARFAALYGLWYPHARDERLFWLALLNQVDGIRLAMHAIRAVQPLARLVQTEDLGRTYATAGLAGQAAFDNQRRWMSWDLLCGLVTPGHPLWEHLCRFGFETRLRAISDDPCPPDVIGIDHYLTSDRLLDERLEHYPAGTHGGNGARRYADVEATRVLEPPPQGLAGAIREAWERYRTPIALTEIHNGCTREEQVRWLDEAWAAAREARAEGIGVCAVGAWALFGSRGWSSLLTADGSYEPGAFDCSGGRARETALAAAVRRRGSAPREPGRGWWRRDSRLHYPASPRPAPIAQWRGLRSTAEPADAQPILILGATGTLGRALAAECAHRDLAHILSGRERLDLGDPQGIDRALAEIRPRAVVNAAGWVRVDDAQDDPRGCFSANAEGAIALATACGEREIPTVSFSSDLVFDGLAAAPYREGDRPNPLNVYGRSKARMEAALRRLPGKHLVVRTAAFFSPFDEHNFAIHCLRELASGRGFAAARDCVVSPTYVPDLCRHALDLLIDGESGVWHLTNGEATSWLEFAQRLTSAAGLDGRRLRPASARELGWRAPRPAYVPLSSARGLLMPPLESALERFVTALAGSQVWRARQDSNLQLQA